MHIKEAIKQFKKMNEQEKSLMAKPLLELLRSSSKEDVKKYAAKALECTSFLKPSERRKLIVSVFDLQFYADNDLPRRKAFIKVFKELEDGLKAEKECKVSATKVWN